jgi:hypothetical protein
VARHDAQQRTGPAKDIRGRCYRVRAHSQISLSSQPSSHTGILGISRDTHEARTSGTRLQHHEPPASCSGARHVVVDSTGLKVYGAGEWYAGKYRRAGRRVWRKLHLGVDETTREILAADVTESRVHDSRRLPALLSQVTGTIAQVSGDRGYDTRAAYEAVLARGAVATIVPRRNARMSEGIDPPTWRAGRDATLRAIAVQGRYGWRTSSGCSRQSLAENAMFRFKVVFGGKLWVRTFDNQRVEAAIKCAVLNQMTGLGMPHTLRVL